MDQIQTIDEIRKAYIAIKLARKNLEDLLSNNIESIDWREVAEFSIELGTEVCRMKERISEAEARREVSRFLAFERVN